MTHQQSAIELARTALEPFAKAAEGMAEGHRYYHATNAATFLHSDLYRARAAYEVLGNVPGGVDREAVARAKAIEIVSMTHGPFSRGELEDAIFAELISMPASHTFLPEYEMPTAYEHVDSFSSNSTALLPAPPEAVSGDWQKTVERVVANLRHAYQPLVTYGVTKQKDFADGLIAPAIRQLEELLASAPSAPAVTVAGDVVERRKKWCKTVANVILGTLGKLNDAREKELSDYLTIELASLLSPATAEHARAVALEEAAKIKTAATIVLGSLKTARDQGQNVEFEIDILELALPLQTKAG